MGRERGALPANSPAPSRAVSPPLARPVPPPPVLPRQVPRGWGAQFAGGGRVRGWGGRFAGRGPRTPCSTRERGALAANSVVGGEDPSGDGCAPAPSRPASVRPAPTRLRASHLGPARPRLAPPGPARPHAVGVPSSRVVVEFVGGVVASRAVGRERGALAANSVVRRRIRRATGAPPPAPATIPASATHRARTPRTLPVRWRPMCGARGKRRWPTNRGPRRPDAVGVPSSRVVGEFVGGWSVRGSWAANAVLHPRRWCSRRELGGAGADPSGDGRRRGRNVGWGGHWTTRERRRTPGTWPRLIPHRAAGAHPRTRASSTASPSPPRSRWSSSWVCATRC